ncbi:hypothetical protein T4B_12267 [Trichinella pseudospiralis]|uniref:Uncharacterized protein n=1 Tax=Trichinella pseudospiralis TaxID=6337 RepID=A0A0V1IJA1_TRIPS|nr:hypothetical protein T4A_789 [Trichinella pseudospiralis]KRY79084.1 hypothetical protein T4A_6864 [Trichinella pseudospiralis]KRZ20712.1 hypothetical protein T4B_4515 [Trichinella pseudospiralis]KRZ22780.1 hypothetical protein T4C_11441 [Trichinella pseudospiralis]KRZ23711.1 hypothetical protein T4B_12267 [Trichinella pseudospiralis]
MARYMASNSRPNALYLISRGWKRREKNARGDQHPLCSCCSAAPAAWSDASTTSDKAAPSWGWLNSVALASASLTASKALTASSDSFSLLCELCEDRCQQRGSSRYESAIEIHTTEELAELVHGRRLTESAYRFDFFCQRLDALAADLEPEELKVWREENAFCRVQLDAVLFKPLKKSSKHVVQVDEAESQPSSHFVHETLECLSSISQTERHSHVFKKAERCRDGRLWNIFFRHWDLLIGADQVNFGEDRPAAQLCDEVIDVGYRVSVGLRHVVEASIISTWAPGVWLFLWDHVKR